MITAKDIMTKEVISTSVDATLPAITELFAKNKIDGVPVVDNENVLQGIITEYDLISKESLLHLPTLKRVMENLNISKQDQPRFKEEVLDKLNIKASDIMNKDPLVLTEDTSYEEVIKTFQEHHRVNPIPVIDDNRRVVGIISRFDVLKPLHGLAAEMTSK